MIDSIPTIVTFGVTLLIFIVCVIIHYEGLRGLSRWSNHGIYRPRRRIAIQICALFLLHIVEITLFALAHFTLANMPGFGELISIVDTEFPLHDPTNFAGYIYYSSVSYTTLGMGEIVPFGPIRILTGMEAVGGLLLITWSASFMFIEMQRHWGSD